MQHVTLETVASGGTPVVGDHVRVGASDKLLSPVVGDDRTAMGFNAAMVLASAHHLAIGVPACCRPNNRVGAVHG